VKQVIAIILLSLFFLQAIPVTRLFAATNNTSYTAFIMDEDKSDEAKGKERIESKEYLSVSIITIYKNCLPLKYHSPVINALPSPYLESFTPPPNSTC